MTFGDDKAGGPLLTLWESDHTRAEQRRTLLARAQRWSERERVALAGFFYEALLTSYPSLRRHVDAEYVPTYTREFSERLRRLVTLDDDRQRLGVEALRLGATLARRGMGADEYKIFASVLAHVLAEFQDEVPYLQARLIWQADLTAIVEVMMVVGTDPGSLA